MSEATYEKYQAPPAPLNFAAAKSAVRDKGLVDMLESFYKSSMPPAETHVMPEEEIVRAEQTIEYLIELDSLNKELLPVLEAEIVFQKENRTTVETTLFDLKVKHPLFHEQIEDEFERREWFKGTEYER